MSIVRYPFGWERYTGDGFKLSSRRGWFFLSLRTKVYLVHIELGRLSIAFERKLENTKRSTR